MSRATETLFYPFRAGTLASPRAGQRFLFLGAVPDLVLPPGFGASLVLVQGFRPLYNRLRAAGHDVRPEPDGHDFDGALVLCCRHRGQNEGWLAQAIERVRPGGLIVAAGTAEDGISSLRKRLQALLPVAGYLPKFHGVVLWLQRPDSLGDAVAALRPASTLLAEGFVTAPGMFSQARVDPGSRLLAGNLPDQCRGSAADFGAGWGFLAASLVRTTRGLDCIDLYEADYASLDAAKQNLRALAEAPKLGFFWHDLAAEKVERRYDLVVMNPPFHHGRAAEPAIGQAMIRAASAALKPGGRLIMVQNRGLPYRETLDAVFGEVRELAGDAAFRVVAARR